MLHTGHAEFFQGAVALGDQLYVSLGSDQTVYDLKGRPPINSELRAIQPDIFVVNEDGNTPDKRKLVESLGIEYAVLQRTPHDGFLPRSTTDLRKID